MLKRMLSLSLVIGALGALGAPSFSDTLLVPAEFATIQAAIDASLDGDVVLVSPGVYVETIEFLGRAIHVTSVEGPASTILEADPDDSVVVFSQGEGRDSVLEGFTVRGGHGRCVTGPENPGVFGGGILIVGSSPTITGNRITGNRLDAACGDLPQSGGGIAVLDAGAAPAILGNVIDFNELTDGRGTGAGLYIGNATAPEVTDNVIAHNTTDTLDEPFGGGIYCFFGSEPRITGNVIEANEAQLGGGISLYICGGWIEDNDIRDNVAVLGGGLRARQATATVLENRITGNQAGSGAGVYTTNGLEPTLLFRRNLIEGNTAGFGGGLLLQGPVSMDGDRVLRNTALKGGGIRVEATREVEISNCIVAFNQATDVGGGVYIAGEDTSLQNCTIYGNEAGGTGGGIWVRTDLRISTACATASSGATRPSRILRSIPYPV